MTDWHDDILENCLEILLDYRGKSPPKASVGIPVLSAKVVKTSGLLQPIEQKIAFDYYAKWMVRGLPHVGDVVMTTEGPMGEVIQLTEETVQYALGQRIVCLRGKSGILDNTFLRYLLSSPSQQNILEGYSTGTTVPGISQKALRSLPISYPPFDTQRQIGILLSSLDDKIDLNRRTNETLEAMARALFRDWFVDFGPTRAKMAGEAPYLAPELWELFPDRLDDEGKPEGWINSLVGKQFDVTMGQSPPGNTYNSDGVGIPFYQGKTDFGFIFPQRRMYCTAPTRFANALDSLVSVRAPVGDVNFSEEKCCIGRGLASVRHPHNLPYYTYFTMKFLRNVFSSFENTGTVFGSINKKQFEDLFVIESGLEKAFESQVMPTCSKIIANEAESRTLAQLRDLLLPKLMSGEISIRDAEKMVEDAA
ncbi:MAG: restriction endonuclease subunit S [Acetobacter peroxydans]|jgi:type I restriction enzyme S subunit|nr:restriction endonuclease subunit S [Acetobacter peroxydans]